MAPVEIWPRLFIGNEKSSHEGFISIIQAAKDPWHRSALGYKGASAPQCDEYLVAFRDSPRRWILNLVDSNKPNFVPQQIIDLVPLIIKTDLEKYSQEGGKILIQCNRGESRAPFLGLIFLIRETDWAKQFNSSSELLSFWKDKTYPPWNPGNGIKLRLQEEIDKLYDKK